MCINLMMQLYYKLFSAHNVVLDKILNPLPNFKFVTKLTLYFYFSIFLHYNQELDIGAPFLFPWFSIVSQTSQ